MIAPNVKVATGFYTIWDAVAELDENVLDWMKKQEKTKPKTEFLNSVEAAYTFKYGLERMCVHASKFVFTISKYNVKKERDALQKGVLAATAVTRGDLNQNLRKATELPKSKIEARTENMGGGYNFCLIPTYINMKPKILTGLDDTFAAVQAAIALG